MPSTCIRQFLNCDMLYLLNLDSLTLLLVPLYANHLTILLIYEQYFSVISLFMSAFDEHHELGVFFYCTVPRV